MAKIKSLQSKEESKSKKAAEELRYGNKTEKQKKFLKKNSNVTTAAEMDKKIADYKSSNIQTRMSPSGYEKLKSGGRAGYKGGKSVKKKGGCAIKGKSPILR